jgi:two-component system CheB/CheR fusion protein
VFPRLLENKDVGAHIRIWVPACSTGEEAYSIAICLLEIWTTAASDYRLQMFGTDVDEASIQHARRGVYPQNIALDVSPERLHRFFIKRSPNTRSRAGFATWWCSPARTSPRTRRSRAWTW